MPISPHRLLSTSMVFQDVLWTHPWPILFEMANMFVKVIRHPLKITTISGSAKNVTGIITGVNLLPYPGLGVIITFSSETTFDEKIYNITLCNFLSYTYPHYGSMNGTSIGKCGMYINCKNFYYIFKYLCKLDYKKTHTSMFLPSVGMKLSKCLLLPESSRRVSEQVSW